MTTPEPIPTSPVVEAKVKTSAAAAAVAMFVLSLVQQYVFKGNEVPDTLAVLVTTVVSTVVAGGLTFIVGWLTKHTPRWLVHVNTEEYAITAVVPARSVPAGYRSS